MFMPEGDKYHHRFRYSTKDGMEFTDLSEINTLDFNKLPPDCVESPLKATKHSC